MTQEARSPNLSLTHHEHHVRPQHTNTHNTLFGGEVMAWVDIAAATCAMRHSGKPVVTAAMDAMHFLAPIRIGWIAAIDACVNFAAKTSCEVGVRVTARHPVSGEAAHTASAYLTFVALDDNNRPTNIPPVKPETAVQKARFQDAIERRKARLALRDSLKKIKRVK